MSIHLETELWTKAEAGEAGALEELARRYGLDNNLFFQRHLLQMAAEKGSKTANYTLGLTYYEEDKLTYRKYMLLAAKEGDTRASINYGIYNYNVKQNYREADKHWKVADIKGNKMGAYYLGLLQEQVKKNFDKALEYYLRAKSQGALRSLTHMAKIYEIQGKYPEACRCFLEMKEKKVATKLNIELELGRLQEKIGEIYDPVLRPVYETKECALCLEEMDKKVSLPCGHLFHKACIEEVLKVSKACPICRGQRGQVGETGSATVEESELPKV